MSFPIFWSYTNVIHNIAKGSVNLDEAIPPLFIQLERLIPVHGIKPQVFNYLRYCGFCRQRITTNINISLISTRVTKFTFWWSKNDVWYRWHPNVLNPFTICAFGAHRWTSSPKFNMNGKLSLPAEFVFPTSKVNWRVTGFVISTMIFPSVFPKDSIALFVPSQGVARNRTCKYFK